MQPSNGKRVLKKKAFNIATIFKTSVISFSPNTPYQAK
jgi:hypothetical protein